MSNYDRPDRGPRRNSDDRGRDQRDGGDRRRSPADKRGGSGRPAGPRDRPGRPTHGARNTSRPDEPAFPEDVAASDLDTDVRRDLLTLDKTNADIVARHLVMVTRLLEEDPARALAHARAARERAGRVGLVRETLGIAAYNAGEWQEAVSELRAARRITGSSAVLPLIADAERGLGRPERAVEIARSEDGRALTGDEATEMRIVESGARIDLGEPEKALVTLQADDLTPGRTGVGPARLYYAYASALAAVGRADDAVTWFMNAASADVDDVTDAEFRLVELTADPDGLVDDEIVVDAVEDAADPTDVVASAVDDRATTEAREEPSASKVAEAPADQTPGSTSSAAVDSSSSDEDEATGRAALGDLYDALLLDLDGTVFAGQKALPGARESLGSVGTAQYFVTNNASRRPAQVVEHLRDLGFAATEDQVVTSAQSAARLLAEHVAPGSIALVVGTDGLAQEVREVGIGVTRSADDRPAAVIQGHSPETGWAQLSEAVLAINAGALWIATNVDPTLPSERGPMMGNGSMVAAVANATGQEPLVAGKPAAPLMADAIARSHATRPLVIGDRLDTDIEGAHSVGLDSALVLTGVSTVPALLAAPPEQRPTYVIADLTGLGTDADTVRVERHDGWHIDVDGRSCSVSSGSGAKPESLVPALAAAVWHAVDTTDVDPVDIVVTGADETARSMLAAAGVAPVR